MSLKDEKAEIWRLRHEENLTLKEIANRFGKSIYWVNSRLVPAYEPKKIRRVADDDTELPADSLQPRNQTASSCRAVLGCILSSWIRDAILLPLKPTPELGCAVWGREMVE